MTSGIFLLVITAAICHALWNFAARKVAGDLVVIRLSLCAGCLLLIPGVMYVIYHQKGGAVIPLAAVPYMIATGVIHALYFGLLARAYECGEISVVYPIARGSGIGLIALLAWFLLKEDISVLKKMSRSSADLSNGKRSMEAAFPMPLSCLFIHRSFRQWHQPPPHPVQNRGQDVPFLFRKIPDTIHGRRSWT